MSSLWSISPPNLADYNTNVIAELYCQLPPSASRWVPFSDGAEFFLGSHLVTYAAFSSSCLVLSTAHQES